MSPRKTREPEHDEANAPPGDMPQTAPARTGADHSFTLQAVMEMQKSIGSLEKAVDGLSGKLENQGKSIDRIKYILAFAAGVAAFGGMILGYVIDKRFDSIMSVLSK